MLRPVLRARGKGNSAPHSTAHTHTHTTLHRQCSTHPTRHTTPHSAHRCAHPSFASRIVASRTHISFASRIIEMGYRLLRRPLEKLWSLGRWWMVVVALAKRERVVESVVNKPESPGPPRPAPARPDPRPGINRQIPSVVQICR